MSSMNQRGARWSAVVFAGAVLVVHCTGFVAKPGNDTSDAGASSSSTSSSASSGAGTGSSSGSSSASSSSSGGLPEAGSSSSASGSSGAPACAPALLEGNVCGDVDAVCVQTDTQETQTTLPYPASNGSVTLFDAVSVAPLDVVVSYVAEGSRVSVVAVFFGAEPVGQPTLCERLDALGAGEAAVLTYRHATNDWRTVIATSCAALPANPTAPSLDNGVTVHVSYDGTQLEVSGTTTQGSAVVMPASRAFVLAPSVHVGVHVQGDTRSVRLSRLAVTCKN